MTACTLCGGIIGQPPKYSCFPDMHGSCIDERLGIPAGMVQQRVSLASDPIGDGNRGVHRVVLTDEQRGQVRREEMGTRTMLDQPLTKGDVLHIVALLTTALPLTPNGIVALFTALRERWQWPKPEREQDAGDPPEYLDTYAGMR